MTKCNHCTLSSKTPQPLSAAELKLRLLGWAKALGFAAVSVSDGNLRDHEAGFLAWLAAGHHGEMDYMSRHGLMRARPAELLPGTRRVISLRLNYWPKAKAADRVLADGSRAYISRYALARDYHKLLRKRLQKLAQRLEEEVGHQYRVFVDSAPVMEVALAERGGLGWRGKHTLLLHREAGSLFFLGEIFTDIPLPVDQGFNGHCGSCTACIDVCPTQAIIAPYQLDARRCISYLTIELKGAIPEVFRPLIGNRIYGCDDCQLACPWNRFAQLSAEKDLAPRHGLDDVSLIELFAWHETDFSSRMAGSPIYRIGYERWLRNLAVGLGNAPYSVEVVAALRQRQDHPSSLVREHVAWALVQHGIQP